MSSDCSDAESSDSLEAIEPIRTIRPSPAVRSSRKVIPSARHVQQNNTSAARSLSPPTSVLSLSGDKSSLQLCLNVSVYGGLDWGLKIAWPNH